MKEQHILLFSHGQTIAQLNRVFSDANTTMTDQGVQEVLDNIKNVRSSGVEYKKIYCSNLPRAIQTAEIISRELGIPFEIVHELAQQDFGVYTGKPNTEKNYKNYIKDLLEENGRCEPITSVLSNLKKSVIKITEAKENAIIVAHRFTWIGFEVYFNGTIFTPKLLTESEKKVFVKKF